MQNVKAKGLYLGEEVEAIVVNPCGWFGAVHLLGIENGHYVDYFAIEADSLGDAIDELVESKYGHLLQIDESDRSDYGYESHPGDQIGRLVVTEHCWVKLDGSIVTDPQVGKYLQEPKVTGQGVEYDSDHLAIAVGDGRRESWKCRYYGEGLPGKGIKPKNLEQFQLWRESQPA